MIQDQKSLPSKLNEFVTQLKEKPDFIVRSTKFNWASDKGVFRVLGLIASFIPLAVFIYIFSTDSKNSVSPVFYKFAIFDQMIEIKLKHLIMIIFGLFLIVPALIRFIYEFSVNRSWFIGTSKKLYEYNKNKFVDYDWKDFTGKNSVKGATEIADVYLERKITVNSNVPNSKIFETILANLKMFDYKPDQSNQTELIGYVIMKAVPQAHYIESICKRRIEENIRQ